MLRGLLAATLERLESLRNFYTMELSSIEEKTERGCFANAFGYMLDSYLRILSTGSEAEKNAKTFLNMQESIKDYVEVTDLFERDGTNKIMYRLLKPERLKEKGYEVDVVIASRRFRQFAEMPEIHSDNTLVMLITRFEEFISRLLGQIYNMFPQKYLDNQEIKFSEIVGIGIDEVRSNIVDREIDFVMRKSYTEWFEIFQSHGMSFMACEDAMQHLKEVYARRNIIVHNSGVVNNSYLKMVPNSTAQIGEKLESDNKYIYSAFSTVTIVIYTIAIESARLMGKNAEEYLIEIFNEAFDELQKENYSVCANVFCQLSTHKGLDGSMQLMSKINHWISRVELGDKEKVCKEVEELDVSALNSEYLLAKLILLEKYDKAVDVLENMFKQERLSSYEVESWPLFMHFRGTELYEEFKRNHAEDFEVNTVEVEQKTSVQDVANLQTINTSMECVDEQSKTSEEDSNVLILITN